MYKSKLQELCHKKDWDLPIYQTAKDGPDHCPRFTTTISIQGQTFETPKNVCRSSKEAQNLAAEIAFHHLGSAQNAPSAAADNQLSPVTLASPGSVDVKPAMSQKLKPKHGQNAQTSVANQSVVKSRDEMIPKDLHVYKNRLQHYAQKKNLSLPEYSCEIEGPPHARQYKASVKIGGSTYTSPFYFATMKDSEHAAAKVAFESLSVGEVQEDEGLYKTLLQELAQKKGLRFPLYTATAVGPPHMPTFVSTVEIGGECFVGRECKTKKLSEMNAAKVAYNGLLERHNEKGNTKAIAGSSQPITSHGSKGANTAMETHSELAAAGIGEIHSNYSVLSPGDPKSNALDSVVTYNGQENIQPKSMPPVTENDGKDKGRSSLGLEESDAEKLTGVCTACGSKIVIRPRNSTIKIAEGATILPCSDDKWVAAKVETQQPQ